MTSPARPDIILLTLDQWRWDALAAVGGRHPVLTPHLDLIADAGVRFERCYADCPVCMPQRITLMTGMHGLRHGRTSNFPEDQAPSIRPSETLAGMLSRDAGYEARAVGKLHLAPSRARWGFDRTDIHPDDYLRWLEDMGHGGQHRGHGLGGNDPNPVCPTLPSRFHHTAWTADRAVQAVRDGDPTAPLFLWTVFESPHSPFEAYPEHLALFDGIDIPDPASAVWDSELPAELQDLRWRGKYERLSSQRIRTIRRHYYACLAFVDYQIGRLIGALRDAGRWDDAWVFATSDHGEHLGDHGLFHKCSFLESSARVPLLVKPPRSRAPQTTVDRWIASNADVPATIAAIAGIELPGPHDGCDLRPRMERPSDDSDRILVGVIGGHTMACSREWKLLYWRRDGRRMLFRPDTDPDDRFDLIADPACSDVVERLEKAMLAELVARGSPLAKDGRLVCDGRPANPGARRNDNGGLRGPMRGGDVYHPPKRH